MSNKNKTVAINEPKKNADKKVIRIEMYDEKDFDIPKKAVLVTGKQILGSRKSQQDAFDTSFDAVSFFGEEKRAWAVVCDGMGGMASGDLASQTAKDVVKQILYSALPEDSISDILRQAVIIANDQVKGLFPDEDDMTGTTMVCAVVEGNKLYYASVGDSRLYIKRENELIQVTRDHNYFLELKEKVDRGEMTLEEAQSDPQREALISYLGISKLILFDINDAPITLENGDIILLCSDGLTKVLSKQEILELINYNYDNIDTMVDALLFDVQATKPMGLDNTTIAIMKYIEN